MRRRCRPRQVPEQPAPTEQFTPPAYTPPSPGVRRPAEHRVRRTTELSTARRLSATGLRAARLLAAADYPPPPSYPPPGAQQPAYPPPYPDPSAYGGQPSYRRPVLSPAAATAVRRCAGIPAAVVVSGNGVSRRVRRRYGQPQPEDQPDGDLVAGGLARRFFCGWVDPVGIVLGIVALNQIKETRQGGHGLAIAGIAVGAASLIIGLIWFIFALSA